MIQLPEGEAPLLDLPLVQKLPLIPPLCCRLLTYPFPNACPSLPQESRENLQKKIGVPLLPFTLDDHFHSVPTIPQIADNVKKGIFLKPFILVVVMCHNEA